MCGVSPGKTTSARCFSPMFHKMLEMDVHKATARNFPYKTTFFIKSVTNTLLVILIGSQHDIQWHRFLFCSLIEEQILDHEGLNHR